MYVFDDLPDNQVAIYSKMHHACIDGGAGAAMAQLIYDTTPTPRDVTKPSARKSGGTKNDEREFISSLVASSLQFWSSGNSSAGSPKFEARTGQTDLGSVLVDALMDGLRQSRQFVESLPDVLSVVNEVGRKIASPTAIGHLKTMIAPPTPLNRSISSERSFAAVSLPMHRVRAIATAAGTKLNDVVLAISSGVLRQHLLDQASCRSSR
jgi:diacylglycerol O-acyltransferase / wax synthase